MVSQEIISLQLQAIVTLMMFSFLVKENPLSRIAEHIMVGAASAHLVVTSVYKLMGNTTMYMTGWYIYIPVMLLGLLLYTRYVKQYQWLSRYPTAIMLGIGTGLTVRAIPRTQIINQIILTAKPFTGDAFASLNTILVVVGVVTGISYFLFHERLTNNTIARNTRLVGRAFLMIAFGTGWGTAMAGRGSVLMNRLIFLLYDWLGLG